VAILAKRDTLGSDDGGRRYGYCDAIGTAIHHNQAVAREQTGLHHSIIDAVHAASTDRAVGVGKTGQRHLQIVKR